MNFKFLGPFDIVILIAVIFYNYYQRNDKINKTQFILLALPVFGLALPLVSMMIEIALVKMTKGVTDSLETLYTFLRFPIYWILGVIQILVIAIKKQS